jgi:hypothetical protein
MHQTKPTAIHNNCSGKHAGMLALCKLLDFNTQDYLNPLHPVQQLILDYVAAFYEYPKEKMVCALDGCTAPIYSIPAYHQAICFRNLVEPSQFEKVVYPILALVKRYNISDDIAPNGKPIFGYSKPVFKGGRSNTLVLEKSQIVQVEFTDDKLSKLTSINVKKYKSAPASVNAFYNDINKNKNNYNIDLVTNTKKFIVLKFK